MIHHTEGRVLLEDVESEQKPEGFRYLQEQQRLQTLNGRAEILLAPTSFLRLGAQSEVEMLSDNLDHVAVQLNAGSALVEVVELVKGSLVSISCGDGTVALMRPGLYRFDFAPGSAPHLKVVEGRAMVTTPSWGVQVKDKRRILLAGSTNRAAVERFDATRKDHLDQWSAHRSWKLSQFRKATSRELPAYTRGSSLLRAYRSLRFLFR